MDKVDPNGLQSRGGAPSSYSWRSGTTYQPTEPPLPYNGSGLPAPEKIKVHDPAQDIKDAVLTAMNPEYTQLCTMETCVSRSNPSVCGPNDAQSYTFVGGFPTVIEVQSRGCTCNNIIYPDQLLRTAEDAATWQDAVELMQLMNAARLRK